MAAYQPIPQADPEPVVPEADPEPVVPEADPEDDFDVPIDDHNADETFVFDPTTSTPYQNEQKEKSGLPGPPTFLEDLSELPGLSSTTLTAENEIFKEFPNADKTKIKYKMDSKGRVEVGLFSPQKKYYRLLTEIPGESGKYQINKSLPKEVLRALGESRRETIQKEIESLSKDIIDNKKIAEDTTKDQTDRNKARERAQIQISSRIDLQRQLDQLKAGEYTRDGGGQSISLEVFQNNEEKRQEREKQLQQEIEERKKIMNDENAPISEKEKAGEEIEKFNQELNEIENEREIEAEGLSLRDRLREKVKAIFKTYGVTVTAIFLAAGVTIGAVVGAITNALKSMGNQLANGLKTVGAKAASAVPGLIGAIVSFLFKTAGQANSYLAEHTWLLILAAVVFIFEKFIRKRR